MTGDTRPRWSLHSFWPVGHTQLPLPQIWPPVQTVAQSPQWSGSELVSMHTPLHTVSDEPHPHVPAAHISPGEQAIPQALQFIASVWRSTQALEQLVWPVAQPAAHAPLAQTGVAPEQAVPQPPQLAGSVCTFTHFPPQSIVPDGQAQLPFVHA